jgi:hypothetical protein
MKSLLPVLFLAAFLPVHTRAGQTVTIQRMELKQCSAYSKLPLIKEILGKAASFNSFRDKLNLTGVSIEIMRKSYGTNTVQVGQGIDQIKGAAVAVPAEICLAYQPASELREILTDGPVAILKLDEGASATKGACANQMDAARKIAYAYVLDYSGVCSHK